MIRHYDDILRAIHACENAIKEINDLIIPMNQSNIIHYGKTNISRQNDTLYTLKNAAEADIENNKNTLEQIDSVLDMLEPIYSEVLKRKHVNGEDWSDIAEVMNYSERHIHRIYKKALAHFEILINRN